MQIIKLINILKLSTMEVCRLCLKESYQLLSIFEYKNTEQITKTIMTTIPEIRIFKTDQLSKYICIDCYKVIINFQVLKELSLKNDKLQKSLLIDTKPFNIKIEHEDGIDDSSIVFSYNSYLDNNDEGGDDDNEYLSSKYDLKPLSVNLERLSDIKTQVQTGSKRKRNDDATVREQEILKLKCDLCAKSFRNRGQLENHMSRHLNNDDDVFSCHVCLRMFQRRDSLLAHIRRTHDMYAGHLRCDLCMCEKGTTKMFRLKAKLETHMMVEHLGVRKCSKGSKYFQCSDCSTTYSLFRDLQSHAFFVHNKIINEEPEKRLKKCRFCDETFPTKHQLSCHYDHVHAEERKKHPCSICSQAFMSEDRLEWHIKKIHGTCQRKCTICNIEFSQKRDFVLHKYFHCDYLTEYNEPIKFECILCSFYTFDQEQLYNHLPSHLKDFEQNDKMIIVCINCSKIIDNFDVLHTHTGEHNENITHKCLKCEKKFVMGTKLLKHLMKHDEVVMKLCPYENCKYKSSEKFKLDAHILHKHKNIVSHLCNICGNSFSSRGTLKGIFQILLSLFPF